MRKATRRTGPEQGRSTTQRRGTRGGGVWRSRSCGQGSSQLSQGSKREEAGQSRNRPVQDVADVCVGGGVNPQRRSGCRLSRIENSEGRQGAKPGPGREKGGGKAGQRGPSGQASAHSQREVQKKLRCTCRRADAAGRARVRFHARERRWRQNRRPCDSCHHDGVVSARGGAQTNRLDALVRRCRACRSSG